MRYIRLGGVFGNLEGGGLLLPPGLSAVLLPNEAGKSTWAAFFRAMLYGVPGRERQREGFLPDKTRYYPWSGRPPEGRLLLEADGRELEIIRSTEKKVFFSSFSCVYADSGAPVPGIDAANAGEVLTGAPREVFMQSLYFPGDAMAVSSGAELERKINSLGGAGDEEVSATLARETLKKWRNEKKFNSRGQIPALEAELAVLEREREAVRGINAQLIAADSGIKRAAEEILRCEKAAAAAKGNAAKQRLELIKKAEYDARALKNRAETLAERHNIENPEDMRERIEAARALINRAAEKSGEYSQKKADAELAAATASAVPENGEAPSALVSVWQFPAAAMSLIAAVAMLFVMPLLAIPFAALGVFLLIVWIRTLRRKKAEIAAAEQRRTEREAVLADLSEKFAAATREANDAQSALDLAEDAAKAALFELGIEYENASVGLSALSSALAEYNSALRAAEAAAARYEGFTAGTDIAGLEKLAAAAVAGETGENASPEETGRALSAAREKETAAQNTRARLEGALQNHADLAELNSKIAAAGERLDRLRVEYDAIQLADGEIAAISEELSRTLTPALRLRAEKHFSFLTDGRYDRLRIEKDMRAQVSAAGTERLVDPVSLSKGTADQLYFSLRLALSEALYGSTPPPLILDDVLLTFDDTRARRAAELLAKLAEERQIIFFTCREREAALVEGAGGKVVQPVRV